METPRKRLSWFSTLWRGLLALWIAIILVMKIWSLFKPPSITIKQLNPEDLSATLANMPAKDEGLAEGKILCSQEKVCGVLSSKSIMVFDRDSYGRLKVGSVLKPTDRVGYHSSIAHRWYASEEGAKTEEYEILNRGRAKHQARMDRIAPLIASVREAAAAFSSDFIQQLCLVNSVAGGCASRAGFDGCMQVQNRVMPSGQRYRDAYTKPLNEIVDAAILDRLMDLGDDASALLLAMRSWCA